MSRSYRYSRWDGSQEGFDLDADDLFEQITDDLLQHGDLNNALRQLLQRGFTDKDGNRTDGIDDLLEQLRRRRRDTLERHDVGGVFEDIAERLRDIVDQEREAVDEVASQEAQAAQESNDQRRAEIAREAAMERRLRLDLLPPDLSGQVDALQKHDWQSQEAQQAFEELVEELRQEVLKSMFDNLQEGMQNMDAEGLQAMKDMFNDLNSLIEARQNGTDTQEQFDEFMNRHGQFFPENPQNLDELLEQMAQRMAAMQQLLNSMSPEQRAQLQQLSQQLLEDMDLGFQVNRLSANLQQMFPQMGWGQSYRFQGDGEGEGMPQMSLSGATNLLDQLGDLDRLEQLLRGAVNPGALADVDLDRARELLGPDAAGSLERLAKLAKSLEESGLLERKEGRLELTPKGLRRIGRNALSDLFKDMAKDKLGKHETVRNGVGVERSYETKAYEFGDPFNLQIERTIRNAIQRGSGVPVRLTPDDFEIERTEQLTRSSTVLLVDLSLSMPMRGNFLPAKKVAMALHSLISMQYPRDYLGLVGFSEVAHEFTPAQLPEVSWDYVYGTNMQHALLLARKLLARQSGTKQVIMITDGEPTAHLLENGDPFFHYPTHPATRDATLAEVVRCTKDGITINTFMLDPDRSLRTFVERLTELNRGRAFFCDPDNLGSYLLVDFLEHKRTLRGGRAAARR